MLFSYELRTKIEYISSKQQPFFSGISHTTTHSKAQYGQSEKLQLFCQSFCFEWRSRALNNRQITFHFEPVSINFNAWLPSENLILNLLVETFIRLEYCHAVFYRVIISCKVNIAVSQEFFYNCCSWCFPFSERRGRITATWGAAKKGWLFRKAVMKMMHRFCV